MTRSIIRLRCEMLDDASAQAELDNLRDAARAELGQIVEDLGLAADFRIDFAQVPSGPRFASGMLLDIDGALSLAADKRMAGAVRRRLGDLATNDFIDGTWRSWGGDGAASPAFRTLIRDLIRHRVRPDRISQAVDRWADEDAPRVFEEALAQVSRKISIHVHPARAADLASAFAVAEDSATSVMADGIFYELGLILGQIEVVPDAQQHDAVRVRINDLRSEAMPLLAADECVVNDTVDRLALLYITGREATDPVDGSECAIISDIHAAIAKQAGLRCWDAGAWAIRSIEDEVKRSAPAILTLDTLGSLLDKFATAFPYLGGHVKDRIGVERFLMVLRSLLAEGLPIRNMRHIIDAFALMPPPDAEPVDLAQFIAFTNSYSSLAVHAICTDDRLVDAASIEMAERVRMTLKRYISHKATAGTNTLAVYLLDPDIERRLSDREPLSARERRRLFEAVWEEVGCQPGARTSYLLTTIGIRHRLRSELRASFPHLAVLSYQELSPDLNIQSIARISIEPNGWS